MAEDDNKKKNWTEELSVAASEIMKKIKELAKEGNIRRVIIKKENGDKLLEIPLTAGVVVAGGLVFFAPAIAAVVAVVGLFTRVRIEIIRTDDDTKKSEEAKKGDDAKKSDGEEKGDEEKK